MVDISVSRGTPQELPPFYDLTYAANCADGDFYRARQRGCDQADPVQRAYASRLEPYGIPSGALYLACPVSLWGRNYIRQAVAIAAHSLLLVQGHWCSQCAHFRSLLQNSVITLGVEREYSSPKTLSCVHHRGGTHV